jgi:hypothetical protein
MSLVLLGALQWLADGGGWKHAYPRGAWPGRTLNTLVRKGLAEQRTEHQPVYFGYRITNKGRATLTAARAALTADSARSQDQGAERAPLDTEKSA